jgi:RAP domain
VALELLGPHNAASNTQRPFGPARLKWRALTAAGYRVIVISMWQWQELEGRGWADQMAQQQQVAQQARVGDSRAEVGSYSQPPLPLHGKLGFLAARLAPSSASSDGVTAAGRSAQVAGRVREAPRRLREGATLGKTPTVPNLRQT